MLNVAISNSVVTLVAHRLRAAAVYHVCCAFPWLELGYEVTLFSCGPSGRLARIKGQCGLENSDLQQPLRVRFMLFCTGEPGCGTAGLRWDPARASLRPRE